MGGWVDGVAAGPGRTCQPGVSGGKLSVSLISLFRPLAGSKGLWGFIFTRSLPSRYRPDSIFVGLYEGRYWVVTVSLPRRYRHGPSFVGRHEGRDLAVIGSLPPRPIICGASRGSSPGRYRADPSFGGRYKSRDQIVTAPSHYLCVVAEVTRSLPPLLARGL